MKLLINYRITQLREHIVIFHHNSASTKSKGKKQKTINTRRGDEVEIQ